MKYLFLFAHPDDETVACAGTMHLLAQQGHDVFVVSVTDGSGGEVSEKYREKNGNSEVGKIRRSELHDALHLLGVQNYTVLDFIDGNITNEIVWGQLRSSIIDVIDTYKPDVLITFDHSGWYFHLDHVGVSIATTLAVQQAEFPPQLFFLSHFRVNQTKWKYIYSDRMPFTHVVDVTDLKPLKLKALDLHESQNLHEPRRQVTSEETHYEYYQLAHATESGLKLLEQSPIFQQQRQIQDVAEHDI